jgi:hypothetical protein
MPFWHLIRPTLWRILEWSVVMGALCWLFVYASIVHVSPARRGRAQRAVNVRWSPAATRQATRQPSHRAEPPSRVSTTEPMSGAAIVDSPQAS